MLERLRATGGGCEVVLVAGNHDRPAFAAGETCPAFVTDRFYFHHGDGPAPSDEARGGRTEIIGHHHPAATLRDGAGLALKLPAFVQTARPLGAARVLAVGGGRRGRVRPRRAEVAVQPEAHPPAEVVKLRWPSPMASE